MKKWIILFISMIFTTSAFAFKHYNTYHIYPRVEKKINYSKVHTLTIEMYGSNYKDKVKIICGRYNTTLSGKSRIICTDDEITFRGVSTSGTRYVLVGVGYD